jgi:glycosyltransferase involved in cell wall biosynthesis
MPQRILWITDRYPPAKGGMAVSCARQVRGLRRRGVAVDVLLVGTPFAMDVRIEERDGGSDIYVPQDPESSLAPNQAWLLVRERHARRPYTNVAGFGASEAGYHAVTFAAWLGGLPSAVLVRGNDLDRDWFIPQRAGMVREAFARATVIGAVTAEKAERIRALYPGKRVVWTPNSVDVARWELLPGDAAKRDEVRGLLGAGGARVIGIFGELKAKKRIPFWLEAVRDRGLLDRVRLLTVGTLDPVTAAILDDPAIAPRNLRLPFCPPEELAGLYAACDFVALPSMFEGMPNVLLEAMACGVVPIASDAGAMSEVIRDGETGFLFAAESRDAAGEATARAVAIADDSLSAMSAAAKRHVTETFSLDREIDVLLGLL